MVLSQLRILLIKNLRIYLRKPLLTFIQVFSPFFFLLLLFLLQELNVSHYSGDVVAHPKAEPLSIDIPKCTAMINATKPCFSLIYAPSDSAFVNQLILHLAEANDPPLSIGKNINSTRVDILPARNATELSNFLIANQNTTLTGVSFSGASISLQDDHILQANNDLAINFFTNSSNPYTPSLILAIQRALFLMQHNCTFDIEVTASGYPRPSRTDEQVKSDVGASSGSLWFFCPPMFNFIMFTHALVYEKEKKFRQGKIS
jgi:hypothetical protein